MKTCCIMLISALLLSLSGLAEGADPLRFGRWKRSASLSQETKENFSKGKTAVGQKDFELAAKYFEKVVWNKPLWPEYLIHLALAYDMLSRQENVDNVWGKWEILALIHYRACMAADPKGKQGARAREQASKLVVLLEVKNRKLVEHAYRVISTIGGPDGVAKQNMCYGQLAMAFAHAGKPQGALEALRRVRKTIPRYNFPGENRYRREWEDLEGMDRALTAVITSYINLGSPANARLYVRDLNNMSEKAIYSLFCAQMLAEKGDVADARTFLDQAVALQVTGNVYKAFGQRFYDIQTEIAVTRAMLGDISRAKTGLPSLKNHQQVKVLAEIALAQAKSGNAQGALATAAEMQTVDQRGDNSDMARITKAYTGIGHVSRIAKIAETLAKNGHTVEARTALDEVMAVLSPITAEEAYALYRAHMAVGDIKAAEGIFYSRMSSSPLVFSAASEFAKLQGRMGTAEVADWLYLRHVLKDRFNYLENYTWRDAKPEELANTIIIALGAVGNGRRLISELEKEWEKVEYAPKGQRRYDEAVPETAESVATAEEEENFITAAFKDRSRPILHRIFVSQTEGWIKVIVKYLVLCIGCLSLFAAVLAVFDGDFGDAFFGTLISAALVTIAFVIG